MGIFKRNKAVLEEKDASGVVPLAVFLIASIFITVNVFTHLPLYLESLFIPVKHPLMYKFPKYGELLPLIVKGDYVDYKQLQKSSKLLDEAIAELAQTSPDDLEDEDQRFCFWINTYNMLVLKAISEKYPVLRLDEKALSRSFSANKYFIGGHPLSLEQIRRLQLVPRYPYKPLALFLVCGGSLGSPPLLDHVITPKTMDADGDKAAHKFVLNHQNVLYDGDHKTLLMTPLLKLNESVFAKWGGPSEFANQFLPNDQQLDLGSQDVLFKSYARTFNMFLNDTALQHASAPKEKPLEPNIESTSNKPQIEPATK